MVTHYLSIIFTHLNLQLLTHEKKVQKLHSYCNDGIMINLDLNMFTKKLVKFRVNLWPWLKCISHLHTLYKCMVFMLATHQGH